MVEWCLLWILRHPVHLYDTEVILGTEDKKTKNCNKRYSHCSYCSGNSKYLGSCEPGTWTKTKIYKKHIFAIWMTKYTFLTNHNITRWHWKVREAFPRKRYLHWEEGWRDIYTEWRRMRIHMSKGEGSRRERLWGQRAWHRENNKGWHD